MTVKTVSLKSGKVSSRYKECPSCNKTVGVRTDQCKCGYSFLMKAMRKDLLKKKSNKKGAGYGHKFCPSCKKKVGAASQECIHCLAILPKKIRSEKSVIDEFEMDSYKLNRGVKNVYKGGRKRGAKTTLSEKMVDKFAIGLWESIGGDPARMEINPYPLYIGEIYISSDKRIYIDGILIAVIEVKSYTEMAMLKRILVDCLLVKEEHPSISTYLFQLENALGGDYGDLKKNPKGSLTANELMDKPYFKDVDLDIVTFFEGRRNSNVPFEEGEKRISRKQIEKAFDLLKNDFKQYI